MTSDVVIHEADHILSIRFNRPAKKNAITTTMYLEIAAAIEAAETGTSVRAILLTGTAGNFTSGNDIGEFPIAPPKEGPTPPYRLIASLVNSTIPIVAGVEGLAVGIGATMLLHLDSVVSDARAKLVFPFINLALVPEAGSSLLLPRLLGYTRAAELLMQGRPIDGQRAYELGIVSTLAESGQVLELAQARAEELAAHPPQAMRAMKTLLKGDTAALLKVVQEEEGWLFRCAASAEAQQAVVNLQQKRPPK